MKHFGGVAAAALLVLSMACPAGAEYPVGSADSGVAGLDLGQKAGAAVVAPAVSGVPVPGNAITYWHDRAGNVVGLSKKGQLAWLEMPAGRPHVGPGMVASGYGVDLMDGSGSRSLFDVYDYSSADAFTSVSIARSLPGGTTYPGTLITTPLTVTAVVTADEGRIRLTNVWKWVPKTRALTLVQTWKNVSTANPYTVLAPKLFIDIDANGDTLNAFGRSSRSVFGWEDAADAGGPKFALTVATSSAPFCIDAVGSYEFVASFGCPASVFTGITGVFASVSDRAAAMNLYRARAFEPGMTQVDRFEILVK